MAAAGGFRAASLRGRAMRERLARRVRIVGFGMTRPRPRRQSAALDAWLLCG
ncbi:MAG: hypothetical protein ACLUN5_02610 [Oscillospiraceae bacterium]